MRTVFEANASDNSDDLFYFKGREFPTLMAIYGQAVRRSLLRDYNIDGNAFDSVCFSMLTGSNAKGVPVLSFEKTKDKSGDIHYRLYSRVSGSLKEYEGSFVKLGAQMMREIDKLKNTGNNKVVRANFGNARP